jgi:hypothetical protein
MKKPKIVRTSSDELNESDGGRLGVSIGIWNGEVLINFDTPVVWIAASAEQAEKMATLLNIGAEKARLLRGLK